MKRSLAEKRFKTISARNHIKPSPFLFIVQIPGFIISIQSDKIEEILIFVLTTITVLFEKKLFLNSKR